MTSPTTRNICYVITSSHQPLSERLLREGILPLFQASPLCDQFQCVPSDDIYRVGVFVDGIVRIIQRTALVVADLTGKDPSVTFQVGLAVALDMPIILLLSDAAAIDDVPFDWQVKPVIRYRAADPGAAEFKLALSTAVKSLYRKEQGAELEKLLTQLTDEDREVRREAEETLGHLADPATIRPLCEMLANDDARVRASASLVLRHIGGPQVIEELLERLMDERPYVRRQVAWVLRELHDERTIRPLLHRLDDEVPIVRRTAAWTLGELGEHRALGLLALLLNDEDPDVRRGAAEALGKLGDLAVCEHLHKSAVDDPDVTVRQAAVTSLGGLRDSSSLETLSKAATDKGWIVRQAAARALGAIGRPEACALLEALLQDITEDVRWAAATGLAEIGTEESRKALTRAAADSGQTPFIRGLALTALEQTNAMGES